MTAGSRGPEAGGSRGSGWAPYLAPYLAFLVLVEVERRASGAWQDLWFVLKSTLPLALVAVYAWRGAYPELRARARQASPAWALADWLVGMASAALWVAPYLWLAALRPEEGGGGFRPDVLGPGNEALALGLRALGYALATPFVEELFVRSWLLRFTDALSGSGDFREVPVARFAWRSFAVTSVYFTLSHALWEWPVAALWIVVTHLWFYWRGSLPAVVRVHAGANASILLFVLLCDERLRDAGGEPLSLWFFV